MKFAAHIGVDYSGAALPTKPLRNLCVATTDKQMNAELLRNWNGQRRNWSRQDLFHWFATILHTREPVIVGIDHAFSFPMPFLGKNAWPYFCKSFISTWPSHQKTVKICKTKTAPPTTNTLEYRLTERWTSSAKSIFDFRPQGVAYSSFAGIPWLHLLRQHFGTTIHFWPFDGFNPPPNKSVIVECYPSIFYRRFDFPAKFSIDQKHASAIALWLHAQDQLGRLQFYFELPHLTKLEKSIARREGWILGVA
jgi:hypothetical protein